MNTRFRLFALALWAAAPTAVLAATTGAASLSLQVNGSPVGGSVAPGTSVTILATFEQVQDTAGPHGPVAAVLGASGPWYSAMDQIDGTHFSTTYTTKNTGIDAVVVYDDTNPQGTAAAVLGVGMEPPAPPSLPAPAAPALPPPTPADVSSPASTTPASAAPEDMPEAATSDGGAVLGAAAYHFTRYLYWGVTGDDVSNLQMRLIAEGTLAKKLATGYFGNATTQAVKAYQAAHGLEQTGTVGPKTRAVLNK